MPSEKGEKDMFLEKLERLRLVAEERGSVIYQILFRNAGVAIQWWEEKKSVHQDEIDALQEEIDTACCTEKRLKLLSRRSDLKVENTKSGQVVYGYYSSLGEMVDGELHRLLNQESTYAK